MSSGEDSGDLMAAFQGKGKGQRKAPPSTRKRSSFSPGNFISDQSSTVDEPKNKRAPAIRRKVVGIRVSPVRNRHEYTYYEPSVTAVKILREYERRGDILHSVKLSSGDTEEVSLLLLLFIS